MATTPTFHETFDNGLGAFSRAWGPGVDTSVPGQLTIWTDANNADSGAMMPPTGASAGFGYGLYTETLKTQGTVGVYGMAGWPSTDVWPGPELDMVEIDNSGVPYGTVHWKGADGTNQYQSISYTGVDPSQVHTYAMDWQADHISFYVDGKLMGTVTEHVPADYAHGGQNESMGIGTQTFWNNGALGGKNWITIYDATYAAGSGGGTTTPANQPVSLSAGSGPDSLVLKVSQDAYGGDAQYTVSVDGAQVGGTFTASALHSSGQSDTLTLKGSWGGGQHTVSVSFLNDKWDGTAATDRNLYVDGVAYDGAAAAQGSAALLSNGAATFTVGTAAATLPTPGAGGRAVQGGAGADNLVGTSRDDVVAGGRGDDTLTGFGGKDSFVFGQGDGHDILRDFVPGTDKLVFQGVAAGTVTAAKVTHSGVSGVDVHYGTAGDLIFLVHATGVTAGDMLFL